MLRDGTEPPGGSSPRRAGAWGAKQVLVALLVLVLLGSAGVVLVAQKLGDQVGRYPSVFGGLDATARPAAGDGETFLLMGTDTRSPVGTTGSDAAAPDFVFGAQRSDAIMLATVAGDGRSASVVSIPRDSWVPIPGRGMNKINAAYAFGGPTLLVRTVEALTRVRVDHFAVVDFAGFAQMTDAVGGIDVVAPASATGRRVGSAAAAPRHLDGAEALAYVRQRYDLPGGDFDRVRRQQNALRALVRQSLSSGTLSSPTRAYGLVDTLTRHMGVDDSLSDIDLATFAFSLRGLRPGDVTFLTAPYMGTGTEGTQSVVYLDRVAADDLWFAVSTDRVGEWVAARPEAELPEAPR